MKRGVLVLVEYNFLYSLSCITNATYRGAVIIMKYR